MLVSGRWQGDGFPWKVSKDLPNDGVSHGCSTVVYFHLYTEVVDLIWLECGYINRFDGSGKWVLVHMILRWTCHQSCEERKGSKWLGPPASGDSVRVLDK